MSSSSDVTIFFNSFSSKGLLEPRNGTGSEEVMRMRRTKEIVHTEKGETQYTITPLAMSAGVKAAPGKEGSGCPVIIP